MKPTIIVNKFYTKHAVILVIQFLLVIFVLSFFADVLSVIIGISLLEEVMVIGLFQLLSVTILLAVKYDQIGADVLFQLKQIPRDFTLVIWLMILAVGDLILMSEIHNVFKMVVPGLFFESRIANAILFETSFLIRVVVLVLFPSLCEEVLFRGVIANRLAQNYSEVRAVILSAVLFGISHLSLGQIIPAFLGGLLYGFVYLRTRNIFYSILLHFFYNLAIIISYEVPIKIGNFNVVNNDPGRQPWWFTAIGITLLIFGLVQVMGRSSTCSCDQSDYTV